MMSLCFSLGVLHIIALCVLPFVIRLPCCVRVWTLDWVAWLLRAYECRLGASCKHRLTAVVLYIRWLIMSRCFIPDAANDGPHVYIEVSLYPAVSGNSTISDCSWFRWWTIENTPRINNVLFCDSRREARTLWKGRCEFHKEFFFFCFWNEL